MFQNNQIDAETAMRMLAESSANKASAKSAAATPKSVPDVEDAKSVKSGSEQNSNPLKRPATDAPSASPKDDDSDLEGEEFKHLDSCLIKMLRFLLLQVVEGNLFSVYILIVLRSKDVSAYSLMFITVYLTTSPLTNNLTKDTKTKNSLKARLRRLCEKKKGERLQVPEWLHEQWRSGDHLKMALQYQNCNWNKDSYFFFVHVHDLIQTQASKLFSPFSCIQRPTANGSSQEKFVKRCEKTTTELEREKNVVNCGWYSREDMKSQLKWSQYLELHDMFYAMIQFF